ncbi:MAG: Tfp pilus assembly protein FimT/FimU [Vulcanimicrobiota bacterium]
MSMKAKRFSGGYTLIELIVVLVIFAILFGVTAFNYSRAKQTMALQNAAAIVVMDLKKQRQRTITIDSNCGIQFSERGYQCYEVDVDNGAVRIYHIDMIDLRNVIGADVSITASPMLSNPPVVEFTPAVPASATSVWAPLGLSSISSDMITLKCGDNSKTITIENGEIH